MWKNDEGSRNGRIGQTILSHIASTSIVYCLLHIIENIGLALQNIILFEVLYSNLRYIHVSLDYNYFGPKNYGGCKDELELKKKEIKRKDHH